MGAAVELQRALKNVLEAAGIAVCDFAPKVPDSGAAMAVPTVEIGHIIMTEWGSQTTDGFDFLARIHVRTNAGNLAAKTKQDAVYAALHRKPITVSGHNALEIWRENTDCTRQPDGSFHGVCEYRGQIVTL